MTRNLLGLRPGRTLRVVAAILILGLSETVRFLVNAETRLRSIDPLRCFRLFLQEYAGPLAIVVPLAAALAIARPHGSMPVQSAAGAELTAPAPGATPVEAADVASLPVPLLPDRTAAVAEPNPGRGDPMAVRSEPPAVIEESARSPFTYVVEPGDTPGHIAERFGVSVDTVLSTNAITNPAGIRIGQELLILPITGVAHTVEQGDTLTDIATLYGVEAESIATYNALSSPDDLPLGEMLVVPEGKIPSARAEVSSRGSARSASPTGFLQWPTVGGISTYFREGHKGLDIMGSTGVPVYAADGGTVVTAVKGAFDYGNYLVIDHGNGLRTLYAHLSAYYVDYGERVAKGETIGAVGSTGISTGPHLHLEVWKNGIKVDPLGYLP